MMIIRVIIWLFQISSRVYLWLLRVRFFIWFFFPVIILRVKGANVEVNGLRIQTENYVHYCSGGRYGTITVYAMETARDSNRPSRSDRDFSDIKIFISKYNGVRADWGAVARSLWWWWGDETYWLIDPWIMYTCPNGTGWGRGDTLLEIISEPIYV